MLDGDGDPSCFRIFSWVGKDLQNSHVTAGLPYVRSREELSVRPGITMTWHGLSSAQQLCFWGQHASSGGKTARQLLQVL